MVRRSAPLQNNRTIVGRIDRLAVSIDRLAVPIDRLAVPIDRLKRMAHHRVYGAPFVSKIIIDRDRYRQSIDLYDRSVPKSIDASYYRSSNGAP